MSLGLYKFNDMVELNHTTVQKNTIIQVSNSYTPPEEISNKNITFAFMLSDLFAENVFTNKSYGEFRLVQNEIYIRKNETDGTTYRDFIDHEIPFSRCEIGRNFFYPNEEEAR